MLFNLYIWDLHQHLTSDVQGAGVKLQGEDDQLLVTDFEYADDAALCASSPKQLQDLINSFVAYCDIHGLPGLSVIVNPKKCEVVVFAKRCRAWSGVLVTGRSRAKHCLAPASSSILVLSYTISQATKAQLSIA
jgi:hypothetical protein